MGRGSSISAGRRADINAHTAPSEEALRLLSKMRDADLLLLQIGKHLSNNSIERVSIHNERDVAVSVGFSF